MTKDLKREGGPHRTGYKDGKLATLIMGMDGNDDTQIIGTTEQGQISVAQTQLFDVFQGMLVELKKIHFQLSLMTDTAPDERDVEGL